MGPSVDSASRRREVVAPPRDAQRESTKLPAKVTPADRLADAPTRFDDVRRANTPAGTLLSQATRFERVTGDGGDALDHAVINGAAAAAAGAQQSGRAASLQPTPAQLAVEGYRSAQGPNAGNAAPGADNIVRSAADLIANAPAAQRGDAAIVVERLGVALKEGKLVPSDALRQMLHTAANAPPGSNAQAGAMAQLARAAEVLDSVRLAPGTALAFDPAPPQTDAAATTNRQANASRAPAAGGPEAAARLPQLDVKLVDADLYYRQDNRSLLRRSVDALKGSQTAAQQALTIDSTKTTPNALVAELRHAADNPGPDTQIGRQQAWQQLGDPDAPRQLKASTANGEGFHGLMQPGMLEQLGQASSDPNARNLKVGERSYSLNELKDIRAAGRPQVNERVTAAIEAIEARGGKVSNQALAGITANNVKAVFGDTPPAKLPNGNPVGEAHAKLGPLPARAELPGARQGGAMGAAGAFGVSTVAALADGRLTADEAKTIGSHTATGAAVGALSAKAEQVVTPAIDRAIAARTGSAVAGNALGTSLVSRVAGSTVVGAVISAGMSGYENRERLAKGDSKSIGNVTADTAVGAAAVAGGAIASAAVTGALAGSVVPGVGTAVGLVVGVGIGAAITYGAQLSGARDWAANQVAESVDGLKQAASSAWSGLKGVFS